MDLSKISNDELQVRLDKLVRTERKVTHLILWHINEIESRKIYAELGFGSMYDYLTKHFGYGESSAYRRIQSARLLKQIPHWAEKLESGALTLTQLTQVQKCLKQENQSGHKVDLKLTENILEQIENKSTFETQKVLAKEFNQPVQTHEVVRPQQDDGVRLEIYLTQEQMQTLQQAKNLLSHVLHDANWAGVISCLAEKHVKKVLGKEVRHKCESKNKTEIEAQNEKASLPSLSSTQCFAAKKLDSKFKKARKGVSITTKRKVLQDAGHRCEYRSEKSGIRCTNTYQLQTDHKIPLALGGPHEIGNFRALCRTHNLLMAKKFALDFNSDK